MLKHSIGVCSCYGLAYFWAHPRDWNQGAEQLAWISINHEIEQKLRHDEPIHQKHKKRGERPSTRPIYLQLLITHPHILDGEKKKTDSTDGTKQGSFLRHGNIGTHGRFFWAIALDLEPNTISLQYCGKWVERSFWTIGKAWWRKVFQVKSLARSNGQPQIIMGLSGTTCVVWKSNIMPE